MEKKELEAKMNSISRGSYWFGIIGRMLIFFGVLGFISSMVFLIPFIMNGFKATKDIPVQAFVGTIQNLFTGYLFLIARDAFDSITYVMKETQDIV